MLVEAKDNKNVGSKSQSNNAVQLINASSGVWLSKTKRSITAVEIEKIGSSAEVCVLSKGTYCGLPNFKYMSILTRLFSYGANQPLKFGKHVEFDVSVMENLDLATN